MLEYKKIGCIEQDIILCPKCIELPPIAKKVDLAEQKRKTKLPIFHFNDRIPPNFLCSALLWHRLMGTKVLSTTFNGTNKIRAYAHCAKKSVRGHIQWKVPVSFWQQIIVTV